ncbi:MAG: RDD family protein [Betaproteobacteria bacterium]|nr:RDD family protein [Betaproteobacteria bacterium]
MLMFGLTFVASWAFTVLLGDATHGPLRVVYQLYLVVVAGAYFVYCWHRTGQTLAMKTWGLRVVGPAGRPLSIGRATLRYVLALAGLLAFGLTFWWALLDRERQFLHDRVLRTRVVRAPTS